MNEKEKIDYLWKLCERLVKKIKEVDVIKEKVKVLEAKLK